MKYRILRKSSTPFDKVHEECGVFGIAAPEGKEISAAHDAYTALFALQHRGQEAAGIAVNKNGVIHCHKDVGLVSAVFNQEILDNMPGSMAIGHVRYSTTGDTRRENAQPISITHVKGNLAVAHNGNLVNAGELRREIELDGGIFRSSNDTEVLVYTIVKERLKCGSIEEAVMNTMHRIEGAYSLVVMSPRKLIAARDPHGFRPLCIGLLDNDCYIFASETCALDALGAKFIRDVEPGEVCVVENGELRSMHCGIECKSSACVFEYIYFARPDSIIDGASVELARQEAGKYLSIEHPVGADVVIGVPDSGIPAAIGYAKFSGIPYGVGLIKNRYVGRTFIEPTQELRAMGVRPINNIVDITNYVMLEYGQPMHAFDYRYVKGGKIIVRLAEEGEELTTLDGQVRKLTANHLVIADDTRAVGLAGIMGGENSEIADDTVDVVFESANFDGTCIRKGALALGMRTEASAKFEKGLDPLNTLPAVDRACELVERLGAGEVVDGVIDILNYVPQPRTIRMDPERVNALLGTDIPAADQYRYLERVGIVTEDQSFPNSPADVIIPSWRRDVEGIADLAEEVARFYGYNNIPTTLMRGQTTLGGYGAAEILERRVSSVCRAFGYDEIITYSFILSLIHISEPTRRS